MVKRSPFSSLFLARPWWLGVIALLTWSSWRAPNLHEYAPPREFVTLATQGLRPGAATEQLRAQALALPGVAACAIRPAAQLLTLAYDPRCQSPAQLCRRLALRPLPAAPADARQCPVPAGYVLALEHLRFALNLRRLFVRL